MPKTYILTVAECHQSQYEIEADDMESAYKQFLNGEGEVIDGTTEYIELDDARGLNGVMAITKVEDTGEGDSMDYIEMKKAGFV